MSIQRYQRRAGYGGAMMLGRAAWQNRSNIYSGYKAFKSAGRTKSSRSSRRSLRGRRAPATRSNVRRATNANTVHVSRLERKVNKIVRSQPLAKHTFRKVQTDRLTVAENLQNLKSYDANSVALLEASISQLRYFNPAVPGTPTTADKALGSYSRDIFIESAYSHFEARNNYNYDVECDIYFCTPKSDTTIQPDACIESGFPDQVSGTFPITSPQYYPCGGR